MFNKCKLCKVFRLQSRCNFLTYTTTLTKQLQCKWSHIWTHTGVPTNHILHPDAHVDTWTQLDTTWRGPEVNVSFICKVMTPILKEKLQ